MRAGRWRQKVAVGLMMIGLGAGCEEEPRDHLIEGQRALASKDAELAEQHLEAALAAEPNLFEARRLMVDVEIMRGDYARAEAELNALWQARGFDRQQGLSTAERGARRLMADQYNKLYRAWASDIDRESHPEVFEEVALKALSSKSRDTSVNEMLRAFYRERADRFIDQGDKVSAARELEKIQRLRTFPDTRQEYLDQARRLRREAFFEDARSRFAAEIQPELEASGAYDAENERILLAIEQPVDRRLSPTSEESTIQARAMARQTLIPTLAQLAVSIGGLDAETVDIGAMNVPPGEVEQEQFRVGRYDMVAAFTLESLMEMAFEYAEEQRKEHGEPDAGTRGEPADAPGEDARESAP
ncbi:tetratricopeptide repeat protein [Lujinxingia sediminis]|uniref:Tetratricopeptide repeat protein n=1 Tax=Lujinxingia sediminis TaxID=2480984 RepID=A0ABY0CQV2_9DELT|nr:tetratricopeptide repeat protein [Lujinxingia sediminis]RVU42571.1 tetratricopeptide repeat protein [Lujinxingia sediminis]